MVGKSKLIYIVGCAIIGVITLLIVMLGLVLGGVITLSPENIIISSSSAQFTYDGTAHTSSIWKLEEGKLRDGHTAQVKITGSRTDVGTSENYVSATIVDENGADVTDYYIIEYRPGQLTVNPRTVVITTKSASKVYDGIPLTAPDYTVADGEIVEGEEITIVNNTSITDVGIIHNTFSHVGVKDKRGRDKSKNYEFICESGILQVTPRKITVEAGSATKNYDGAPLICDTYAIPSTIKPVDGHSEKVVISGERTQIGTSPNNVAEVIITDTDGNDVTANYEIEKIPGILLVMSNSQSPNGGNSDDSGKIRGDDPDSPEGLALRLWSAVDGKVYLKRRSWGEYRMNSWDEAQAYSQLLDGTYGADYLTGLALKNAGCSSNEITIDVQGKYFLPYYMEAVQSGYAVQTSDVLYTHDGVAPYTLFYYVYDYVKDGKLTSDLGGYSAYERQYFEFVKQNYLSYPESTKNALSEILSQFDPADPDIIGKVAEFVQKAAEYDLKYDREKLDNSADVVVTFLTDYKKGICQHYASSATLIYRMLGIPARYTEGFSAEAKAGKWVDVTTKDAHAWVEVYIAGTGWVCVEVTGAANGNGGTGDGTGGNGNGPTIRPVNEYYAYDGEVHYHSGALRGTASLERQGYQLIPTIRQTGRTEAGKTEIKITSLQILDGEGNDVTASTSFNLASGYLYVYKWSARIETPNEEKEFDGKPFVPTGVPTVTLEAELGHTYTCKPKATITEVGVTSNTYELTIYDENGEDITDMYSITNRFGKLTVTHRKITVTADSAQKPFDGQPLTAQDCRITQGELLEGDRIEAVVKGTQTKLGESVNKIISVKIIDSNGNDVSGNYAITTVNGTLKVTPPV